MKPFDAGKLADAVARTLSHDFEGIEILKVNVTPDLDHDGRDILRIQIVFEGDLGGANARRVAGAARRLRPTLEEIDVDVYPLLSFVSKLDYEGGRGREII